MDQIGHENDSANTDGNEIPEFHWSQRQRIWLQGITPRAEMLQGGGYRRQELSCITGVTGKRSQDAIWCFVTYDRAYVVEKLAKYWGSVLTEIDRSDVLKLITEAKQRYREIEGEQ